ncbi:hypothetical protein TNCV_1341271 [Trichonephila clavipes]|uniref:Uncharacterized protein n=1 Tax=Trichonephila clavipes TaxID=2585209 RepID=A0A8X6RS54_TRICX|nr:hypothetical protein TNCV_1341271 [Trichonephila clavipes]
MTSELAPPSPNYHTNGRKFHLSTDLACIAALHGESCSCLCRSPLYVLLRCQGPYIPSHTQNFRRAEMASGFSWTFVYYASQSTACLEKSPIMRRKRSHAMSGRQTKVERKAWRGEPRENMCVKKEREEVPERTGRGIQPATRR